MRLCLLWPPCPCCCCCWCLMPFSVLCRLWNAVTGRAPGVQVCARAYRSYCQGQVTRCCTFDNNVRSLFWRK
uniref:Putative secreted protein n=1 Tax=Anopheles darlingi TaxID=43151 RepID=A0A2M4DR94_ANODA